jgi:hypothetical protein
MTCELLVLVDFPIVTVSGQFCTRTLPHCEWTILQILIKYDYPMQANIKFIHVHTSNIHVYHRGIPVLAERHGTSPLPSVHGRNHQTNRGLLNDICG